MSLIVIDVENRNCVGPCYFPWNIISFTMKKLLRLVILLPTKRMNVLIYFVCRAERTQSTTENPAVCRTLVWMTMRDPEMFLCTSNVSMVSFSSDVWLYVWMAFESNTFFRCVTRVSSRPMDSAVRACPLSRLIVESFEAPADLNGHEQVSSWVIRMR